eukprot:2806057-Prymnesium_polylepis.1
MAFETFAIETIEATWGSQRKLSLIVWRAPIDVMVRTSPASELAWQSTTPPLLTSSGSWW